MKFDDIGFTVIDELISADEAQALLSELSELKLEPMRGGIRRIEQLLPAVDELSMSARLISVAQQYLDGSPELVRAIYFDKSPDNNWLVTWHQDRTVAVSRRFDLEGWGPWSVKAGAVHVQPPVEVLDNMITIRIHLDPATRANGCLKVLPGSHRVGLLPSNEVYEQIDKEQVVYCEFETGSAVVMRPHIMHASEKSTSDQPRRILHFEYSSYKLPEGIQWSA